MFSLVVCAAGVLGTPLGGLLFDAVKNSPRLPDGGGGGGTPPSLNRAQEEGELSAGSSDVGTRNWPQLELAMRQVTLETASGMALLLAGGRAEGRAIFFVCLGLGCTCLFMVTAPLNLSIMEVCFV